MRQGPLRRSDLAGFAPVYADVGLGQSKLTWQVAGAIGYSFKGVMPWRLWHYLDQKMKSGSGLQDLNTNGPMIGVALHC